MKTIRDYILYLMSNGKNFFSKKEALSTLDLNQNQFYLQVRRLYEKKAIKNLVHGFYMIIPPEYRHLGSLPPHWIVDPLMKYLNYDYYIGLLSAASLYGATHQQPMTFQVVTDKQMRPIKLGRVRIEFHCYKDCSLAVKEKITLPTGYANISTKEQTLVDLVRFHSVCGYLSNVAIIIRDLGETCTPEALTQVIKSEKMKSVLQRLGYILELVGFPDLAKVVEHELTKRRVYETLLKPDFYIKKGKRVNRWKLIINDTLEIDE
ncbi:MAG: type IV toxin-antitoxin system AbiEi family antitoxin [Chlamydiae bacterium]|nr:type IV toxin-antitoxin system AbiEi family antitoxin [Chlamydiota bacterium]